MNNLIFKWINIMLLRNHIRYIDKFVIILHRKLQPYDEY